MNSTHTPGPWYPHTQEIGGNIVVFISNGPGLFSEEPHAVAADFSPTLCGAQLKREDGSLWPAEANARLISAAPELLDALEAVACDLSVELNERGITGERWHSLVDARAAIAKAKGEA